MATNIPSRNLPLTDSLGRINPVWYEFLRTFLQASVDGTVNPSNPLQSIVAGNGLTSATSGTTTTLTVGQGSGIAVNADDVSVDINSSTYDQAALDDYVLFSDSSDNNGIKKTQVRDLIELNAPGGVDTYVQYNDNGIFGADSGLTYDKAGTLSVNTVSPTTTNGNFTIANNGTGLTKITGTNPVICGSVGTSNTQNISFAGNIVTLYGAASTRFISSTSTGWNLQAASGQTMQYSSSSGVLVTGMD